MPDDALDQVLRLVAAWSAVRRGGGPILDALDVRADVASDEGRADRTDPDAFAEASSATSDDAPARAIRIVVSDDGRAVVNLRVPLALGRAALDNIPGLTEAMTERIRRRSRPVSRARSSRWTTTAAACGSPSNRGIVTEGR